jgi:desulfoferrodoxin (superoxide reductase-like protein)
MLEEFHIHWANVTFSKKILTRMRYMMKEKTKLVINVT